jgi:putative tryptophan/tyrosine transport system substrate-binding protein
VSLKPDVLLGGSNDVIQALMRATNSIPIVYAGSTDPIGLGLIASFARQGAT